MLWRLSSCVYNVVCHVHTIYILSVRIVERICCGSTKNRYDGRCTLYQKHVNSVLMLWWHREPLSCAQKLSACCYIFKIVFSKWMPGTDWKTYTQTNGNPINEHKHGKNFPSLRSTYVYTVQIWFGAETWQKIFFKKFLLQFVDQVVERIASIRWWCMWCQRDCFGCG